MKVKTAEVFVTEEAIARNKHRCDDCPVFDAMHDAGVPVTKVYAGGWWRDLQGESHELPERVKGWLYHYDMAEDPYPPHSEPISFEVSWVEL